MMGDIEKGKSLDGLAKAQGVEPVEDISKLEMEGFDLEDFEKSGEDMDYKKQCIEKLLEIETEPVDIVSVTKAIAILMAYLKFTGGHEIVEAFKKVAWV